MAEPIGHSSPWKETQSLRWERWWNGCRCTIAAALTDCGDYTFAWRRYGRDVSGRSHIAAQGEAPSLPLAQTGIRRELEQWYRGARVRAERALMAIAGDTNA